MTKIKIARKGNDFYHERNLTDLCKRVGVKYSTVRKLKYPFERDGYTFERVTMNDLLIAHDTLRVIKSAIDLTQPTK